MKKEAKRETSFLEELDRTYTIRDPKTHLAIPTPTIQSLKNGTVRIPTPRQIQKVLNTGKD